MPCCTTTSGATRPAAEPALLLIGSPMGAAGFVTLAGHFPDRTVVTYDPRWRAQPAHRRRRGDHGGRARGRPAPADRRAGHRAGGHLRQQRRRGQRAGPGGQAPGAGPDAGGARAALLPELPDSEKVLAACTDIQRTYQRAGSARRWRSSSRSSATRAWSRPTTPSSPAGTGQVRPAGRGRGSRERPAGRAEHRLVQRISARLRSAPGGLDPDSGRSRRGIRPMMTGRTAVAVAERLGTRRSPSRATTAGSSAANTGGGASPMRSPRPCARCSAANRPASAVRAGPRPTPAGIAKASPARIRRDLRPDQPRSGGI